MMSKYLMERWEKKKQSSACARWNWRPQGPGRCEWPMLPSELMVILAAAYSHVWGQGPAAVRIFVDVQGLCYHQRRFRSSWSGLLPEIMLMFINHACHWRPCWSQWPVLTSEAMMISRSVLPQRTMSVSMDLLQLGSVISPENMWKPMTHASTD